MSRRFSQDEPWPCAKADQEAVEWVFRGAVAMTNLAWWVLRMLGANCPAVGPFCPPRKGVDGTDAGQHTPANYARQAADHHVCLRAGIAQKRHGPRHRRKSGQQHATGGAVSLNSVARSGFEINILDPLRFIP